MQHRSPIRYPGAIAGFTIIELMVTVTLASILLAIAVPSFRGMMANNRVVTQSNDFVGALNFARSEAITRNTNVTLCRVATAAATACAGSLSPWANWIICNATCTAAGQVIRRGAVTTYGGTLSVNSNLTADSVTFSSDGLARTGGVLANNFNFTVCTSTASTDNIRQVTLGAGSRLSTTKSSGTC
jgi:type IV fimbrial biogenesis protein FimT